jgi:hypothetical protein
MTAYFLQSNKNLILALYDQELFNYDLSTLSPYYIIEIDEIPSNQLICRELKKYKNRIDVNVKTKYQYENGELHEIDDWVEYIEEIV